MPNFAYTGRNAQGAKVEGILEAANAATLADRLSDSGVIPVAIAETRAPGRPAFEQTLRALRRREVTAMDVMMFSRQIHTLLKAGVPIMRALGGLHDSASNPAMKEVIQDLRESLDAGRELSQALARHTKVFSHFYVAMVRVGESTGRLEEVFIALFRHLEFQKFMREQVKSALRYPMFVVAAMAVAVIIINMFVIPAFAGVFKSLGAELPLMTRILIAFSDFLLKFWPLLLAGLVGLVAGVFLALRNRRVRFHWDRLKMHLPIAGPIILKATLARFARSLALAIRSGVPIVNGLTLTGQTVENLYMEVKLDEMRRGVERGESILRNAVNAKIFTPVVLQMIMVGEESGALDDMMDEIAQTYQQEVEYDLKSLSAQIEPILIVALGIMVMILALGVFLPMWDFGKAAIKH